MGDGFPSLWLISDCFISIKDYSIFICYFSLSRMSIVWHGSYISVHLTARLMLSVLIIVRFQMSRKLNFNLLIPLISSWSVKNSRRTLNTFAACVGYRPDTTYGDPMTVRCTRPYSICYVAISHVTGVSGQKYWNIFNVKDQDQISTITYSISRVHYNTYSYHIALISDE